MVQESSIFALGGIWVDLHPCCFSGPAKVPVAKYGEGEISTEVDTKKPRRSRSARISRRLVPLAQSASAPIDFSSPDHSRTLLEQAFDNNMYQLK